MQLLDADYLDKWEAKHAPALQQAVETRRQAAKQAGHDGLARARSAIVSGIMRWRREGYTKAEAAAMLPVEADRRLWGYSYTDLLNILPELGVSRADYMAGRQVVAEINRKALFAEPNGGAT